MLTILGSLLGFGTSFLPKILGYFEQKQSNAHELAMLEKQAQLAEQERTFEENMRRRAAIDRRELQQEQQTFQRELLQQQTFQANLHVSNYEHF